MPNPFLFVLGCPRSGTTLLKRMIEAHPRIAMLGEIQWLGSRYAEREGLTADGMVTPELGGVLTDLGRGRDLPVSESELTELLDRKVSYAELLTILFDRYGAAHRKGLVGHKHAAPAVPMDVPTLSELWPEAVFVHLIRDGRDVSLSARSWRVKERLRARLPTWDEALIPTLALWWEWQVRLGRQAGLELGPGRHLELHYERLVASPAEVCEEICAFADVPYDDAMTRFHEHPPATLRPGRQVWAPPTPGRRDWRSQMSGEEQAQFESVAGDLLDELGYERTARAIGPDLASAAAMLRDRFPLRPLPRRWKDSLPPLGEGRGGGRPLLNSVAVNPKSSP